jgi:hypothetical protein
MRQRLRTSQPTFIGYSTRKETSMIEELDSTSDPARPKRACPEITPEALGKKLTEWIKVRQRTKQPSVRYWIEALLPQLRLARRSGLTYAEIAVWLEEQGISCTERTLKEYLRRKKGVAVAATSTAKTKKISGTLGPSVQPQPSGTAPVSRPAGFPDRRIENL